MSIALAEFEQDSLALAVARAVAAANEAAVAEGLNLDESLVTITEDSPPPRRRWRIHYGPRNYVGRRGGDLIVTVDESPIHVRSVIHGQ